MNQQFINADTQSSNKCAKISEINTFLFMDIQITTIKLLGKHVIQTNPSKFDERLFSGIHFRGGGGGVAGGGGGGERERERTTTLSCSGPATFYNLK